MKPEQRVKQAESLAQEHNGILPSQNWLQIHGFHGIARAILKYPNLFSHIKQEKRKRQPKEWVQLAEKYAKQNNGMLPRYTDLVEMKHGAQLYILIRHHPKLFSHIPRECDKRTSEKWVFEAEMLAKRNGGTLPHSSWLQHNGFGGLDQAIRRNSKKFSHIPKSNKRGKTPRQWLTIAWQLAKEHKRIPNNRWLKEHGLYGLSQAIRQHPDIFAKIPKTIKRSCVPAKKRVMEARKLVRRFSAIPTNQWLRKNGYGGLLGAIRNHPILFASFPQKGGRRCRKVEEWVKIAKDLIKKYGKLPTNRWLIDHGLSGLFHAILRHPKFFKWLKK